MNFNGSADDLIGKLIYLNPLNFCVHDESFLISLRLRVSAVKNFNSSVSPHFRVEKTSG